jgi:putative transposase
MSERRACRVVKQPRGTQRYRPTQRDDEDMLTQAIVTLASQYGRYGYRRITALLKRAGWHVGKDRVERIWRREGLKVPQKQKPRGRLWLNDGSCVRLRPQHANHVWSYDFVSTKTHDGRTVRMLNLIDEHTRESLLVRPERRWSSAKVIESLADVMVMKGVPEHIRSDNGPEFVAKDLRKWLADTGAKTLYIEPGSPWENGYCESFNSKLRDEFLNGEIFYSLKEVQVLAERWRVNYNTIRPTLFARLPIASTRDVATRSEHRVWRSGKQSTLSTSPHPRRRRDNYKTRCATLTLQPVQKIGLSTVRYSFLVGLFHSCFMPVLSRHTALAMLRHLSPRHHVDDVQSERRSRRKRQLRPATVLRSLKPEAPASRCEFALWHLQTHPSAA